MVAVSGACCGGERELSSATRHMIAACVLERLDDEHDVLIERAAPWVGFAAGVAGGALVVGAGTAELAEGD